MSQQEGYSPSFKRPAEIMRLRRKRARSHSGASSSPGGQSFTGSPGQRTSSPACVRPFSPGPLFNNQSRSGGGVKRRNPFANIENTFSPKKKLMIYNEAEDDLSTKPRGPGGFPLTGKMTELEELQGVPSKVSHLQLIIMCLH